VFVNAKEEDWTTLGARLSAIYTTREHRTGQDTNARLESHLFRRTL
jgi:hypothetical protein